MSYTKIAALALATAISLAAQSAQPKPPKVKSNKEGQAVTAMLTSQDPDDQIAKAKDVISRFADSEYRGSAFYIMAMASDIKGDHDNVVVYAEQAIAADPMNFASMALMAKAIGQTTKKFDLDKAEKLAKVEKLLKDAVELSKKAAKPNDKITDEQWTGAVNDFVEPAYEGAAFAGLAKEDYNMCADNFKQAVALSSQADPSLYVRMGNCMRLAKRYDEAIAALDKAINDPRSVAVIKQVATQEKTAAMAAKGQAKEGRRQQ